ncbi:MAG: hypothetical protein P8X91_05075 [Candidatus Bathyarchaeota archaeon]
MLQQLFPLEWVDAGNQASYEFPTVINNTEDNIRNILIKENRPNTVDSSCAITGFYQTQYLVTFTQNILDSNISGTVILFINGSEVEKKLPVSIWVNATTSIRFSYISTIEDEVENKKYVLIENSSLPLSINEPLTVYGNYQFQPSYSEFPLSNIILLIIIPSIPTSILIPLFLKRRNKKMENNVVFSKNIESKGGIDPEKTEHLIISNNENVQLTERNLKANCPQNFGYLHFRPKDSLIPIECLSCEKMNKCIENKS